MKEIKKTLSGMKQAYVKTSFVNIFQAMKNNLKIFNNLYRESYDPKRLSRITGSTQLELKSSFPVTHTLESISEYSPTLETRSRYKR